MKKSSLFIMIILLASMILRLYPTFISKLPFSTDAWPLIRNTEQLLKQTPTSLSNNPNFDDYNIYWPFSQIFGAIISTVINIQPIHAMRYYIPLVASLTPLLLYILLRRITGETLLSFLAALIFASSGPHAILTAGVTKETYANPLYIQTIYFFLSSNSLATGTLPFAITITALVMTHHLTYLVLTIILTNILLAKLFLPYTQIPKPSKGTLMILITICAAAIYYFIYAYQGLKMKPNFSDALSIFSFEALIFMPMLYIFSRPKPRRIPNILIIPLLISFGLLTLNQFTPIVPAAPKLSFSPLFYTYVTLLVGLLSVIGLYAIKRRRIDNKMFPFVFWLTGVLGLATYALFGARPELSLTLLYRLYNFIFPALSILASLGIFKIAGDLRSKYPKIISIIGLTIFLVAASASQSYSALFLQENYLGYQWLYNIHEYNQASWIKKYHLSNQTIYGDVKIRYLLGDYMELNVNSEDGYLLLNEKTSTQLTGPLVTYSIMKKNGYVIGPYGLHLPSGWMNKLERKKSIIFSNLNDKIYFIY